MVKSPGFDLVAAHRYFENCSAGAGIEVAQEKKGFTGGPYRLVLRIWWMP